MLRFIGFFVGSLLGLLALGGTVAGDDKEGGGVVVDKDQRTITIDAKIAPRKIDDPRYKEIYPIEVIACWPFPKGQKAHETVVTIEAKPSEVHKALESLGLKPGAPVRVEGKLPQGPAVKVFLLLPGPDGEAKRVPIEKTLLDPKTNRNMPKVEWRFTGSVMVKPDPNKEEMVYGADQSGTLIAIFPVTDQTVFQTNLDLKDEKYLKLETDKKLLPKEGTPVKLVLEVPAAK
jgi:hypothetical protein